MKSIVSAVRRWGLVRSLVVAIGVLLLAVALVAGGAAGLAWTNTEAFCISCHEMRDNVYAEYKDTVHDRNRTGVRAICSDCHAPREPVALMIRKFQASFELYHKAAGTIDTKEKFEAKRYELARRVWARMKKTDSHECRNCHQDYAVMADLQTEKAQARHIKGKAEGKTCIDCHFGIAHKEPEGPEGPQDMKVDALPPGGPATQTAAYH